MKQFIDQIELYRQMTNGIKYLVYIFMKLISTLLCYDGQ